MQRATQDFSPSIAADPFGGVHLLYAQCLKLDNPAEETPVAIGYAYWRNVGELTGAPFHKQVFTGPFIASVGGNGNDYHMIRSDGSCRVHAVYCDGFGVGHRRIDLVCPPPGDVNADTQFNISDVELYLSMYGNADMQADLNLDLQLNVLDLTTFLASWQCQCRP
jgi:hypothetical protein